MPAPDQKAPEHPNQAQFLSGMPAAHQHDHLASEIRALRKEFRALREAVSAPLSSTILTGRDVVEQYKRLPRR